MAGTTAGQVESDGNSPPTTLPEDFVQPWEELDTAGHVVTGINSDSDFLCGVETTYRSAAGVSDNGEAANVTSGEAGSGTLGWAMYRVVMGGEQPGVVSADINPGSMSDGGLSEYYVGLGNYGTGTWDWSGPFTDSHVRLSTGAQAAAGAGYLTEFGNLYVCVTAFDGATLDIVGIGANPRDAADTEAPPMPEGIYATPADGALDIRWDDVLAGDLAGYRVYWSTADFTTADDAGVECCGHLIGRSSHLLAGLPAETIRVRISAVDLSGNESALSAMASVLAYEGSGPELRLSTSAASGMINDAITLTATGAAEYAWDLDGDGIYEITGDTTGEQAADTGRTGIIRPAVRGTTGGSSCVACGAVSLIVASNSRPVANAYATPTTGVAPLEVSLIGGGIDDDGTLVSWSWDFDGDGVFDQTDTADPGPFAHTYDTAGLYNTKFRVEDDLGSWDIDTIAILVTSASGGSNNAPTAVLAIGEGEESGNAPHSVHLDATGSSDPDEGGGDGIAEYHWDFDGDGLYDGSTDTATYAYTYTTPGIFNAKVKVVDTHGAYGTDTVTINVGVTGNNAPTAHVEATPMAGDAPIEIDLDASLSSDSDGYIVRYDWDLDGDYLFEITDGDDAIWEYLFEEPGEYSIGVRVTDDQGAQDAFWTEVTIRGWHNLLVSGHTEPNDSIRIVDLGSRPAIACDFGEGDFPQYVLAKDSAGLRWNEPIEPVSNGGYGAIDMILVGGWPAIAYPRELEGGNSALTYVRAANGAGTSWGTPVNVSTDEYSGRSPSMAIVSGNPAITTINESSYPNYVLHYYRADNTNGTSWSTDVTITTDYINRSLLMVADGLPMVFYRTSDPDAFYYVKATDATGSTWGSPVELVSEGASEYLSWDYTAAIVNGNPAIVYSVQMDSSPYTETINFLRADDAAGTSWGSAVEVSTDHNGYNYSNLAIIDGNPAFCFLDGDFETIAYIRATDTTGATWGTAEFITPTYWVTQDDCFLAEIDGRPVVAYSSVMTIDEDDYGQLMYAIRYE